MQRRSPTIWTVLDDLRQGRKWPDWCYLPVGLVADGVRRVYGDAQNTAVMATTLATLAAWRMTQGIYRIDPAVYPALLDTPIDGDVPVHALTQMPEWCVYIESPGIGGGVHGAWAMLDSVVGHEMRLWYLLDVDPTPIPAPVDLTGESIQSSLARLTAGHAAIERSLLLPGIADVLGRLTSLLLYICSDADISGKHGQPGNPVPVRTRRDGWKLFAAQGPRTWDVGVRMGAALRRAYQAEQTGGGEHQGPRPHIRRAHCDATMESPPRS